MIVSYWGLIDTLIHNLPLWGQVLLFIGLNAILVVMIYKALKEGTNNQATPK